MDIGEKQIEMMQHIDNDAKMKANELRGSAKGIERFLEFSDSVHLWQLVWCCKLGLTLSTILVFFPPA
jgi:hypothetical protein